MVAHYTVPTVITDHLLINSSGYAISTTFLPNRRHRSMLNKTCSTIKYQMLLEKSLKIKDQVNHQKDDQFNKISINNMIERTEKLYCSCTGVQCSKITVIIGGLISKKVQHFMIYFPLKANILDFCRIYRLSFIV